MTTYQKSTPTTYGTGGRNQWGAWEVLYSGATAPCRKGGGERGYTTVPEQRVEKKGTKSWWKWDGTKDYWSPISKRGPVLEGAT